MMLPRFSTSVLCCWLSFLGLTYFTSPSATAQSNIPVDEGALVASKTQGAGTYELDFFIENVSVPKPGGGVNSVISPKLLVFRGTTAVHNKLVGETLNSKVILENASGPLAIFVHGNFEMVTKENGQNVTVKVAGVLFMTAPKQLTFRGTGLKSILARYEQSVVGGGSPAGGIPAGPGDVKPTAIGGGIDPCNEDPDDMTFTQP